MSVLEIIIYSILTLLILGLFTKYLLNRIWDIDTAKMLNNTKHFKPKYQRFLKRRKEKKDSKKNED